MIKNVYERLGRKVEQVRTLFGRPLTLAEKILGAHLCDLSGPPPERQKTTVALAPDRVAMQDATAQMAILQFMRSGRRNTAVPATVHCDHLIRAQEGVKKDMLVALDENHEVYEFLRTAAGKYGMGFWKPGSGIIHQVVLENYAFPGGMMIGTDSHTPNAGGLGVIAIGVGGADAVDVMVGEPFGLLWPGAIGVRLTGELRGWASPKDIILKLMGILTVKGGTNSIVEFFGSGAQSVGATGKATVCNMGAEHGATTSVFPYDSRMADYLQATGRAEVVALAEAVSQYLQADAEVIADPEKFYDRVVEIDLSALEPMIVGPHTPDLARPISRMAEDVRANGYPDQITFGLIGSCTNSSYEDMGRAAAVARQGAAEGLRFAAPLLVTPGSDQIHNTIERDGQKKTFEDLGAAVLANACGPCIGQWRRTDAAAGTRNSIISSYNRNFPRRNDGNPETLSFIASPEIVTALAFAGRLSFNPLTDTLINDKGATVKLEPPTAEELPRAGFAPGLAGFIPPSDDPDRVNVAIAPDSQRLQELAPFPAWDGKDPTDLVLLIQTAGKCTTDHISAAGPWLRFRGHLDNISDNAFLGATNRFTSESGVVTNRFTGEKGKAPEVARDYKRRGAGWVVVGDYNYGEGSSREHAAMTPRHLGCRAVIVRSFARIHETNLKKQGVLPLIFVNPDDYERVREDDRVNIKGVTDLAPGRNLTVTLKHGDGTSDSFEARHTLTAGQIEWFKAGSALNAIAARQK
ncbi:MAG: aconitate hydratase [Phycisphaerales bacterium]|nr:MAG: aconitate hydratase [Phycisphaerales bacterium]